MNSLALCAAVGDPRALLKPGAEQRPCAGTCGRQVWVSPTTLALPRVTLMCNECGRAAVRAQQQDYNPRPIELRIAPGALRDDTPADRRRRNELEARGFRDATPEEIKDMSQ